MENLNRETYATGPKKHHNSELIVNPLHITGMNNSDDGKIEIISKHLKPL